jgi:hypothetical protein
MILNARALGAQRVETYRCWSNGKQGRWVANGYRSYCPGGESVLKSNDGRGLYLRVGSTAGDGVGSVGRTAGRTLGRHVED